MKTPKTHRFVLVEERLRHGPVVIVKTSGSSHKDESAARNAAAKAAFAALKSGEAQWRDSLTTHRATILLTDDDMAQTPIEIDLREAKS